MPVPLPIHGRGASHDPPNRFERLHIELDAEEQAHGVDEPWWKDTVYYRDTTRTILARNRSPDIPFEYSVNVYRGCAHGCIYCYARPTHEYLGFSAGLDFERRLLVKADAPRLLRRALSARSWQPQVIAMSGVTDPYQPIERRLRLTRGCLEVLVDHRNPVAIITKNHLVTRDEDLLSELARFDAVVVNVSITTLSRELQSVMEPRTSIPARRLAAISRLAANGIRVRVMVAPVIPGLTDHELPEILAAAAEAGASGASYQLVRLPMGVADLFGTWLEQRFPARRDRVLSRIREIRGGKLNESAFGARMRGRGEYADQIGALFAAGCRRAGFSDEKHPLSVAAFRRPGTEAAAGQLTMDL